MLSSQRALCHSIQQNYNRIEGTQNNSNTFQHSMEFSQSIAQTDSLNENSSVDVSSDGFEKILVRINIEDIKENNAETNVLETLPKSKIPPNTTVIKVQSGCDVTSA